MLVETARHRIWILFRLYSANFDGRHLIKCSVGKKPAVTYLVVPRFTEIPETLWNKKAKAKEWRGSGFSSSDAPRSQGFPHAGRTVAPIENQHKFQPEFRHVSKI